MKIRIFLVLSYLSLAGCDPGPKIEGKPVSYWMERVYDLDPQTSKTALENLRFAQPAQIQKYRKQLTEIAKNPKDYWFGVQAAEILFKAFGDTEYYDPKFYIDFVGLDQSADAGMRKAALKDKTMVVAMLKERGQNGWLSGLTDGDEANRAKQKNKEAAAKLAIEIESGETN